MGVRTAGEFPWRGGGDPRRLGGLGIVEGLSSCRQLQPLSPRQAVMLVRVVLLKAVLWAQETLCSVCVGVWMCVGVCVHLWTCLERYVTDRLLVVDRSCCAFLANTNILCQQVTSDDSVITISMQLQHTHTHSHAHTLTFLAMAGSDLLR